ncbi:ATP-binding cassette sub-family A member 3 [Orchesella cincta]|uniref:ATP-binding cassette sub-family A member 3 n=1 Tax=Orchesella cincta TaxID=48709 RepID=A0A1D2NHI7_ORCCI|nr:ATP-binding cassette sub-family A member 3 [Orchesella cincta]
MTNSQQSLIETDVGGEESRATESKAQSRCPRDTSTKKKIRKCLRPDIGHSRNIFVTTFYRIWMYRRRHLFTTMVQLIVPPMIILGMIMYMGTLLTVQEKGWSRWDKISQKDLIGGVCGVHCANPKTKGVITLHLKHSTTVFAQKFEMQLKETLAKSNIELLSVNKKDGIIKEAIHHHLRHDEFRKYIAGIEVQNPDVDSPGSLFGVKDNFKLAFTVVMAQKIPEFGFNHASTFFDLDEHQPEAYYQLVGIELAVFSAFRDLINMENNATNQIKSISLQSFPYPPHKSYSPINEDGVDWTKNINATLTVIFVLSMIPTVFTVVEGPVTEKEDGFKLYLQLMGYPRGAYWFSWILNQFLVQCIVVALQVFLLFFPINENTGTLMKHGDWRLWLVVLLLYNLSCLTFFVFLAAFFRRGKMATYLVILIWCLFYHVLQSHIPATLPLLHVYVHSTYSLWHLICLVPSGAIYWAVFSLTAITSDSWDTIGFPVSNSDFTLINAIVMMIADFFIYFFLTLYVDNLNPGPFQFSQPWNYFFEGIKPRFIDPLKDFAAEDIPSKESVCTQCENCAPISDAAIEFDKISKRFYVYDAVYGLENVKFTVHTAKITVILGHKDSGRTTLMRLVCGEYAPTSGTASVFGYDVRRDAQKVQSYLSICMEKNLLCEYLTVTEHMQLIGKLKGLSIKDTRKKAKLILESLGLLPQANDSVWRLVNWQKRVLCVAMAILGSKRILLLDEPTKGLDLDVQRQIWALLKQLKKNGKTILLLSNNIEEAYQIADKIVIMSRGKVAGAGTPNRLEQIFESGYHIHMNVIPNSNKDEILSFIQKYVPSAKEVEGSLRQVSKAMQISDWDKASQALLMEFTETSPTAVDNEETVIEIPDEGQGGSLTNSLVNVQDHDQQKESTPTIVQLNKDLAEPFNLTKLEISYVLPFQERTNFSQLFIQLDNTNTALKLGIKSYSVEMHDMEHTFYRVDDYVDIVNATNVRESTDRESGDFSDIKPLKLPDDGRTFEPLPTHSIDMTFKSKLCSGCIGLWALIAKRFWFFIGNYRHAIVQILGPLLIVFVTIYTTNMSFDHKLAIFNVKYNTSKKSDNPVAPYRINSGSSTAAEMLKSFERAIATPPNNIKRLKNLETSGFDTYITEDNRWALHNEVILGADFTEVDDPTEKTVTAMFSPGHLHAAPLAVLFMCQTILDFEFPNQNYDIEMNTQALAHDRNEIFLSGKVYPKILLMQSLDITFTVSIAFSYFIFTSGFAVQPCAEQVSKNKRYQLNIIWNALYWTGFACIDVILNLFFTTILALIMYFAPSHEVFKNPQFMILFIITGCLGGFSSTLMSYCLTHFLMKPATSYYVTLSINQVLGLFIFLLYTIFNFDYIGPYVGDVVSLCLQCIQPFTLPWNFYNAILLAFKQGRCLLLNPTVKAEMCSLAADSYKDINIIRKDCCDYTPPEWTFDFIVKEIEITLALKSKLWIYIVIQLSHCVGLCFLLTFMERRTIRRKLLNILIHPEKPVKLKDSMDLESIANNEKFVDTVEASIDRDKYFIVRNLGTSTFRRNILHGVTFATEPGKCIAIVGPETSGLTTLFEIMAGFSAISDGDITYGGHSLFSLTGRNKLLCQLGFCPSSDVTIDKLSGLQLLKLFGRLRGIPEKALPTHIDYWVQSLKLERKIKKRCQSYSAVIRKKLNVAIAAIGNPLVVIFDDPVSQLDPESRTQVCTVLESLVHANRVVILMTHELASVEKFCSKLIFLVNGQMHCTRDPEAIRQEISHEFTLVVRLKGVESGNIDFRTYTDFKSRISGDIESATLQEEHSHTLIYRISSSKYRWSNIFDIVEKITSEFSSIIQDYKIRKRSLQDVFNSYASKQQVFRTGLSAWDEFRSAYC